MIIAVYWIVNPAPMRIATLARFAAVGVGLVIFILLTPQTAGMVEGFREFLQTGAHVELIVLVIAALALIVQFLWGYLQSKWIFPSVAIGLVCVIAGRGQIDPAPFDRLSRLAFWTDWPTGQLLLLVGLIVVGTIPLWLRSIEARKRIALLWITVMIILLYAFKFEAEKRLISQNLVNSIVDIQWIGLSYVAFRLLHVLIDFRQDKHKLSFTAAEFVTYAVFFPTLVAGPITRVEEVIPQLGHLSFRLDYWVEGLGRVIRGLFRKFVVAAALTTIALQPALFSSSTVSTPNRIILLIMLYAAFLAFFFDFSGYSDIAIGLGRMYGVRLPENFINPFSRPNLSLFWQNWHATLSTWYRTYWFNPLTRLLLRTPLRTHPYTVIFIVQVSTMVLIGLWHQATPTWVLWGLWNGIGLWAHKVISDFMRTHSGGQPVSEGRARVTNALNILFTFHYVLISFSFVSLSNLAQVGQFWSVLIKGSP